MNYKTNHSFDKYLYTYIFTVLLGYIVHTPYAVCTNIHKYDIPFYV